MPEGETTEGQRAYWDREAPAYGSGVADGRFARFIALYEASCWPYIEAALPPAGQGTVLEAGCGAGRWVWRLAPLGHRVVLCDLSPEMVRQARERVERRGLAGQVAGYHVLDICDLQGLPDAGFDLVLALGGPLSLCRDARLAVGELSRVTRPGGHAICDAANRYRTALDQVRQGELGQLSTVLETGQFRRSDGLTDHRFAPQELAGLFEASGLRVLHLAGVCPFLTYLPTREEEHLLADAQTFDLLREVGRRWAEDPPLVAMSSRLLIVGRREE